jgi:hypothetical protein
VFDVSRQLGLTLSARFHFQDTIAKRLMSNKAEFKMSEMNQVIFRKAADKTFGVRFMSLFPGESRGFDQRLGLRYEAHTITTIGGPII